MREPAVIANLVKPTGEIIVAKERTALQEIQKLQEQIEKKTQEAVEELNEELAEARKVVKGIEDQIEELTGRKARKTASGTQRKPKTCSICKKQGNSGEGHTKRTHAAWLKEQK